jgi:hypothetical protein
MPIIFSFARSGGTLVNQLLGVHPNCLILSEVNPAASVVSVAHQASVWLGLIEANEVGQFHQLPYAQQITLLDERAKSKGKTLIVRDWVTVNYLAASAGDLVTPSFILEQPIYLARAGYSLQPLVVTRRANSVYCSIRRNFLQMKNLSVDDFALSYLAYARAVSNFPRVSLEALQLTPRETLIQFLHLLGLSVEHVDMQLENFFDFCQCTGNNTLTALFKATYERHIAPVRNELKVDNICISGDAIMEADRLLGYEV